MRLGAQIGGRRPRPYDLPPKNPRLGHGSVSKRARLSFRRQSRQLGGSYGGLCPGATQSTISSTQGGPAWT